MKILHIPSGYYPVRGGTELRVQRISETLASRGHKVIVLTSNVPYIGAYFRLGAERIKYAKDKIGGVEVIRVSFINLFYSIASFLYKYMPFNRLKNRLESSALSACRWMFAVQIQKYIKRIRPDVVMVTPHLHPNVKAVIKAHEKNRFPLTFIPCLHEEDPYWDVEAMKEALGKVEVVLATTDYEAQRLISNYSVKEENVVTGWLGVDIPEHFNKKTDTGSKEIIFLGRKVPSKGIPLLLEAMKLVWKSCPETKLTLAGGRDIETRKIDKLLNALPAEYNRKIKSLDNISEEEKASLLESASCLVLPSKIESFGGVILEAWAYSTPAIALDLPVFRSFVSPEKDSILVVPDNPEALAEAILRIIQNPKLAKLLGDAGRRKAEERFTWDKIALSYLQAYERAIAAVYSRRSCNF